MQFFSNNKLFARLLFMFDQMKQMHQLRKLQKEIEAQSIEVEENGVKLSMKGDFSLVDITLNPELDIAAQQEAIKRAHDKARAELQEKLKSQMMGMM